MQSANPNVSWTGSQKLYDWSPRLYELPPLNRQDWILMNARTESQWMSGLNLNKCPDWIPLNVRTESQWMSGLNPNNCQKGIKRKRWLNLRIKVITAKHHWINNDFNDYKVINLNLNERVLVYEYFPTQSKIQFLNYLLVWPPWLLSVIVNT